MLGRIRCSEQGLEFLELGALLVELSKADIRTELGLPALRDRNALSAAIADLAPHKKRGRRAEPAKSQPGWWPSPRSRSEKVDESAPATVIPVAPEEGEEATDEDERDMEESLWEAALLVGAENTSIGDAATTVGLLVLMVATQLIFLYVAAQLGHDKAITAETVSEFRKFRVEIAHDVQYYDAARKDGIEAFSAPRRRTTAPTLRRSLRVPV